MRLVTRCSFATRSTHLPTRSTSLSTRSIRLSPVVLVCPLEFLLVVSVRPLVVFVWPFVCPLVVLVVLSVSLFKTDPCQSCQVSWFDSNLTVTQIQESVKFHVRARNPHGKLKYWIVIFLRLGEEYFHIFENKSNPN